MKRLLAVAVALSLATAVVWAQMPKAASVVHLRLEPAQVRAKAGSAATVNLIAQVQEGFHINSNRPLESYLIPTRVELVEAPAFLLSKIDYPNGELKSFDFAPGEQLSVYEGTLTLPLRLKVKRGTPRGNHTVRVAFHYQACNDQFCLPPFKKEVTLQVELQ
ncbi:MAG TPA: protein-disulfide reductase DsbD domain-containing protein [Candidatus Xenobia bacterium]|nr:protein-disulfide reductase DsbD domain-containing protein [Candidatus Xenobia bacterium]